MKYGLPESAIQKIQAVLRHYPQVEKAILYGSRAKGNYKNGSDIDLTLQGTELSLMTLTNRFSPTQLTCLFLERSETQM